MQKTRRGYRPRLTIVLGTNGAGKSTWCSEHEDELPTAFYDADSIANGLGDWNTGHTVDAEDIRRRWHNAQYNLARTAHAFTRIDLYDNSGTTYRRIAVLKPHGIEQVSPEPPAWVRSLLERIGNLPGLSLPTSGDSLESASE